MSFTCYIRKWFWMLPLVLWEKISHLMSHQLPSKNSPFGQLRIRRLPDTCNWAEGQKKWHEMAGNAMSRWWFQTFFHFHPDNWGRWTHFKHIFSDGVVQPPTSCGIFFRWCVFPSRINLQAWSWVCFVVIQRSWGGGVDIEADCVGEIEHRPWQVSFFAVKRRFPF